MPRINLLLLIFVLLAKPIAVSASEDADQSLRSLFAWPTALVAPTPAFNPMTPEKAEAGRRLFFDPRLSNNNDMSCATCHQPGQGWSVGTGTSRALLEDGAMRRVQHLITVGWSPRFGWDGAIDSLEGFVLAPIARPGEMAQDLDLLVQELNDSGDYKSAMQRAFGNPEIKISRISQSLATFVRQINPAETSFVKWLKGDDAALSDRARDGLGLFAGKANCIACHSGWRLTDDRLQDIGIASGEETGHARHDPKNEKTNFAFKTPSLHGVGLRAPYMHDGSFATLLDVVEHYEEVSDQRPTLSPDLRPNHLTDQEKLNLLEFLDSL